MTLIDDARHQQIMAADPEQSVFVSANAGSGKTTTLVDRVARLLLRRVPPGEILCVTYTKAAAAEMQGRLFKKLGEWAVANDDKLRESLSELDGRDPGGLGDADLSQARRLFARALETPGGLKIQTIHAFCEKLLRRFPVEAGVSPRFKVLENEAAVALSKDVRDDLARAAARDGEGRLGKAYAWFVQELDFRSFNDLLKLMEGQRDKLVAAVEHLASGVEPTLHQALGTFEDETPESVEAEFLRWVSQAEWLAAAEALGTSKLLTDRGQAAVMMANVPPNTTLSNIEIIFCKKDGDPRGERLTTNQAPALAVAFLEDLSLKFISVRDRYRAARVAEATRHALTLAQAHAQLYEAAKARTGALDFSDLVLRTVDLLTVRSNAAWVLFKLDGGIEHVLIDEAQDTAPEQWAIFRALTEEFFSGAGVERRTDRPDRTVFVVGDQKQSIYSFQGARPEFMGREAQTYSDRAVAVGRSFAGVELNTSFRSTEEVLAFVDEAFDTPERERAVTGRVGDTSPHIAARTGQHGCIDLWPLFEDPPKSDRRAVDPVDFEGSNSARKQLAHALADQIRHEVDTGVAVHVERPKKGEPVLRPCKYGDYVVLVRRRDVLFEEIIRALKAKGIPVAGADRLKLSSHIVFDDLIAVARFALFPDDDLSLACILRSPFCDVPDFGPADSLYELAGTEDRKGQTLWKRLQDRSGDHPAWRRAVSILEMMIAARELDPFGFFSTVLNRIDDTGASGRGRILTRLGPEANEAIDETLAQVLAAEDRGGTDLETCLSLLEAADVEVKREMEGARNEVRVMTVHGSKGLEAPIVILPDTTTRATPQGPGLMPLSVLDDMGDPSDSPLWIMCPSSKGDDCKASKDAKKARLDRTNDEQMRLLYVALTRARERVVVMGRKLGRPNTGYDENSWWDVIAGTFAKLTQAGGPGVRSMQGDVLRYGFDPVVMLRVKDPIPSRAANLPQWVKEKPPVETVASFASPSRMDETLRLPAPSPLAKVSVGTGGTLGRFRRGDLIHGLLERLPDVDMADRQKVAERILSRERDLDDDQRTEMIEAATRVLKDDRFAPVFGPGSRAEVALVGRVPGLVADRAISGRIDRLVVTLERVLVVDFKTNRPAPARIENADPAYVLQQAIYVAVLEQIYPDRPVEAALVWTDGPALMPIPATLLAQAMSDARTGALKAG